MLLKLNERLRSLRSAACITQKTLAEYLGVSEQAVSRWESGVCYPDIEYLPAIASFFGVTTDDLLGCDRDKAEKERLIGEIYKYLSDGKAEEGIALARTALTAYPDCVPISIALASSLFFTGTGKLRFDEEEARSRLEESVRLSRWIMLHSSADTDEITRGSVRVLLIRALSLLGRRSEAVEAAWSAPPITASAEMLLPLTLTGEERLEYLRFALAHTSAAVVSTFFAQDVLLEEGGFAKVTDEGKKIARARQMIDFYDAFYALVEDQLPEAKYSVVTYGYCHLKLSRLLLLQNDADSGIRHLHEAAKCARLSYGLEGAIASMNRSCLDALTEADEVIKESDTPRVISLSHVIRDIYLKSEAFSVLGEEEISDILHALQ